MKNIPKKAIKVATRKEPSIKEDIRRLGVIVEAGNDRWDMIAEQYGDISKKLDTHAETLAMHTETLAMHTELFGKVLIDLSIIKEDIGFIKTDLKKKVDIDQFAALEKRVALLERKGFAIKV